MRFVIRTGLLVLTLAAASVGCASSDGGDDKDIGSSTEPVEVEVFSWWTAPGEAEALQSLFNLHRKKFPTSRIFNAATDPKVISGGVQAKEVLQKRLEDGDPPDSFQTNAFELHRGYLAERADLLSPLDDLFEEQGLSGDIVPELRDGLMVNGHVVAVPVNVHRDNSLFYNQAVFTEHGVEPPKTMGEFLSVCEKLKREGVTPLAISTSQSWITNKVFLALALGSMGTDKFVKYFIDKAPIEEVDMAPAIALLDRVLTDYIDVEAAAAADYGWTQAADDLHDGKAAMFIHGDWAKGYLTQIGWTPGVDFGVTTTPDSGGAFLYGSDVFAIPAGAKHKAEALDWLRTVTSAEGQIAFNEAKGSSPVRLSLRDNDLDPMAKGTYADLKNSTNRLQIAGVPSIWDDGLIQLAKDHDQRALLKTLIDNPIP